VQGGQAPLKKFAAALGASVSSVGSKGDKATYIISNESAFHKFHKTRVLEEDEHLVSLRLFYLLSLGEDTEADFSPYFFDEANTTPEAVAKRDVVCKCEIDKLWDGRKGTPGFITALQQYLPLFAQSEEMAQTLLKEVKLKFAQHVECLHVWKGLLLDLERVCFGKAPLSKDEKAKQKETGKKQKKNPQPIFVQESKFTELIHSHFFHTKIHQMSGFEHRQLLFGSDVFFLNNLSPNLKPQQVRALRDTFTCLQELSAVSYTKNTTWQQCLLVRQRVWVRIFQLPYFLLNAFGKALVVKKLWSNYLHDVFHIGEEFEKGILIRVSMERFEQTLSKLNKMTSNNNPLDDLIRFLQASEDVKVQKRRQAKKLDFQSSFFENHVWEELSVDYTDKTKLQVDALLKELKRMGCKENEHWHFGESQELQKKLPVVSFHNAPLLKPTKQADQEAPMDLQHD